MKYQLLSNLHSTLCCKFYIANVISNNRAHSSVPNTHPAHAICQINNSRPLKLTETISVDLFPMTIPRVPWEPRKPIIYRLIFSNWSVNCSVYYADRRGKFRFNYNLYHFFGGGSDLTWDHFVYPFPAWFFLNGREIIVKQNAP